MDKMIFQGALLALSLALVLLVIKGPAMIRRAIWRHRAKHSDHRFAAILILGAAARIIECLGVQRGRDRSDDPMISGATVRGALSIAARSYSKRADFPDWWGAGFKQNAEPLRLAYFALALAEGRKMDWDASGDIAISRFIDGMMSMSDDHIMATIKRAGGLLGDNLGSQALCELDDLEYEGRFHHLALQRAMIIEAAHNMIGDQAETVAAIFAPMDKVARDFLANGGAPVRCDVKVADLYLRIANQRADKITPSIIRKHIGDILADHPADATGEPDFPEGLWLSGKDGEFHYFCRSCDQETIWEGDVKDFDCDTNSYCGRSERCLP